MFQRAIQATLDKVARTFPVTVLTGPRQSGKTTLLKHLFPDYEYINLERPTDLQRVKEDPIGVLELESGQRKWIIDEAQRFPELFSYIQECTDRINKPGMFILSGSQNFLLLENITQSLAGRAAILTLLPLSYKEYLTHEHSKPTDIWHYLYQGSYPRPYHENLDIDIWFDSYLQTYVERDVRQIINIHDLNKFQIFMRLCAGRHGQLLNLTSLATDCGVSLNTVKHWLGVLESSYVIFLLRPFHNNFKKRIVKTPKLYFYDSAIVCKLLGVDSPEHLKLHSNRGAIFEGFIICEIIKSFNAIGKRAPLFFWLDHQHNEVDLIINQGSKYTAIEIKSSMTYCVEQLAGLKAWQKISDSPASACYLIYTGINAFSQNGIQILPWDKLLNSW